MFQIMSGLKILDSENDNCVNSRVSKNDNNRKSRFLIIYHHVSKNDNDI